MRRTVLVYGVVAGVLIALLELIEYRYLVVRHAIEIYGVLVAVLFAALGIWLGLRITRPTPVVQVVETVVVKEVPVEVPVPVPAEPFVADGAARAGALARLGITPRGARERRLGVVRRNAHTPRAQRRRFLCRGASRIASARAWAVVWDAARHDSTYECSKD